MLAQDQGQHLQMPPAVATQEQCGEVAQGPGRWPTCDCGAWDAFCHRPGRASRTDRTTVRPSWPAQHQPQQQSTGMSVAQAAHEAQSDTSDMQNAAR